MIAALTWLAVGLAAVGAVAVVTLAERRLVLARRERRRADAERRLRPLALALLGGETAAAPELAPADARVLAAVLTRYSQRVTGVERSRVAAFFERGGLIDREVWQLGARRAWRRASAAFALGDMASKRSVPHLVVALDDPSPAVRWAAARSLGQLGAPEAVEPLVYAVANGRVPKARAGQALLAIGVAALPTLWTLSRAPEPGAREFAVELLGFLASPADSALLVERLRDSSADVRAKAARALGGLAAAGAAASLVAALDDRIPFVRAAAARALAVVGDTMAVPALLRVASDDDFDAGRAAAAAVARLAPEALALPRSAHLREAADLRQLVP
jgi:HEAT repeat protein